METTMKTCCQIHLKTDSWTAFRWLHDILQHAVTVIQSAREAQVRRKIQLYFDERLLDEFAMAGKRMAKKDLND